MAGNSGPDIVTNGLVLYLDASNKQSYAGSGTTFRDLSNVMGDVNINNRSIDWTFANDPTFGHPCLYNVTSRTTSAGIDVPMNNGFNKLEGTIEMWLKPTTSHVGGHGWFVNSDGISYTNASNWFWVGTWDTSNVLYFRQGNASTCCNDVTVGSFPSTYYPLNSWNHWTIKWKVSSGIGSIYRNSILLSQNTGLPTDIPNTNPTTTGQLLNGHTRGDNMQFLGYCNLYKIYNRTLSATEIIQNYNATKTRFNLP